MRSVENFPNFGIDHTTILVNLVRYCMHNEFKCCAAMANKCSTVETEFVWTSKQRRQETKKQKHKNTAKQSNK